MNTHAVLLTAPVVPAEKPGDHIGRYSFPEHIREVRMAPFFPKFRISM